MHSIRLSSENAAPRLPHPSTPWRLTGALPLFAARRHLRWSGAISGVVVKQIDARDDAHSAPPASGQVGARQGSSSADDRRGDPPVSCSSKGGFGESGRLGGEGCEICGGLLLDDTR